MDNSATWWLRLGFRRGVAAVVKFNTGVKHSVPKAHSGHQMLAINSSEIGRSKSIMSCPHCYTKLLYTQLGTCVSLVLSLYGEGKDEWSCTYFISSGFAFSLTAVTSTSKKTNKQKNLFNSGHLFCVWNWELSWSFKYSGRSSLLLASSWSPWTCWNQWLWESEFLPGLRCQHWSQGGSPKGLQRGAWGEARAFPVTWRTLGVSLPGLTLSMEPEMSLRRVPSCLFGKVAGLKGHIWYWGPGGPSHGSGRSPWGPTHLILVS